MNTLIYTTVRDDTRIKPSSTIEANVGSVVVIICDGMNAMWYYDSTNMDPISTSNTLKFDTVKSQQGGYYYCYGRYPTDNRNFLAKAELLLYGKKIV